MGFRFRKSFGKGPFRVTISKSGVSYSAGIKGFRYTKKANGGTRITSSIPGTGISYVTDSKQTKERTSMSDQPALRSAAPKRNCCRFCGKELQEGSSYCYSCERFQDEDTGSGITFSKPSGKLWWVWLIVGIIGLRACGAALGADKPKETEPPIAAQTIVAVTEAPTAAPTEAPEEPTSWFFDSGTKLNVDTAQKMTYILNTSTKVFHRSDCSRVDEMSTKNKSQHTGTREDMIDRGYKPCGRCNP